jgi:hypothetical protein
MPEFEPVASKAAYQVIRIIYLRDDDLTAEEISSDGLDQGTASTILELFADSGLLSRNKQGKTSYRLETSFLIEKWTELWSQEISQDLDPSGKREKFLEKYIEIYFNEVADSTVGDMLVDDFFQGLREFSERDDFTPDWVEMWHMTLRQNYSAVQSPMEIFEEALDEVE